MNFYTLAFRMQAQAKAFLYSRTHFSAKFITFQGIFGLKAQHLFVYLLKRKVAASDIKYFGFKLNENGQDLRIYTFNV